MPTSPPTSDPSGRPHVFRFGPFRLESEIDIPELRAAESSSNSDARPVTIRLGGVPAVLEASVPYGRYCRVAPAEFLLDIPGTARYYVRDGSEVRLEIAPGAPIANISTYLLGSVFGVLCHQNGLLPLHAGAVEYQGTVIAFLGDSGAGKSTLVACLQRRGHAIVSDDICLLESGADSPGPASAAMQVIPVAGWLKLWNESLQHLGETPHEQHRVFSTDDKYRVFLPGPEIAARHLGRVIFLARSEDAQAAPTLDTLDTPNAIAALMDMIYAAYVPLLTGQQTRVFRQCARVFDHARAFRLTVPWGLDRIDSVLDLLEREIFIPLK